MNVLKLKGRIVEKGLTLEAVADSLGVDRSTLSRRLSDDGNKMTIGDARKLVDLLGLSPEDAVSIFFTENIA